MYRAPYEFPERVKKALKKHDWRLRAAWHPRRRMWVIVLLRSGWDAHPGNVYYGLEGRKHPAYIVQWACSSSGLLVGVPRKPDMRCYHELRRRDLANYRGGQTAFFRDAEAAVVANEAAVDAAFEARVTDGSKKLYKKIGLDREQVGYLPRSPNSTRRTRS